MDKKMCFPSLNNCSDRAETYSQTSAWNGKLINFWILNSDKVQSTEQLKIASGNGKRSQLTNRCRYLGCRWSFTRLSQTKQSIGGLNKPEMFDWQWSSCGNLIRFGLENISDSAGMNSPRLNNTLPEQNATSFCKTPRRSTPSFIR